MEANNYYSRDEEQAEAIEHMAEAMRILNWAIRRAHVAGLMVDVKLLRMRSRGRWVPQIDISDRLAP